MINERFDQQDEPLKNNDQPVNDSHQEENNTQHTSHNSRAGLADRINGIITSPTEHVRSTLHHQGDWSNTGTNTSYEGTTAPGGGGSVGTGQGSGQSATGATITTSSSYENATPRSKEDKEDSEHTPTSSPFTEKRDASEETDGAGIPLQQDHDDDRDTLGNP